jgi:hypothetical protein
LSPNPIKPAQERLLLNNTPPPLPQSNLGTEEALLAENKISHLFFPLTG